MNFQEISAFAARNPSLSMAFVGLTIAIVISEIARIFRGYRAIKPPQLVLLMNQEKARVLDVSGSADFEKGHIAGSQCLPASQLDPQSTLLASAKMDPVIVVCRTGQVSANVAKRLIKAGFKKVFWLEGGIATWQLADLPLLRGRR